MFSRKIHITEVVPATQKIFSHLVTISDTKILFNFGTNNDLDTSIYDSFKNEIKDIDFILLNHSELNFVGALPYLIKNGFRGKIYSTLPIKSFGKIMLQENFNNKNIYNRAISYSFNDIEKIFDEVQSIKYLQPIELGQGIRITAYNSGYGLGGSIWRINQEEDSLLFGIYFDHKKTNHLNGIDFALPKNSIFICDSSYILGKSISRKERNSEFKERIIKKLKENKKVVIIVDYLQFMEIGLLLDDILIQLNSTNKSITGSCIGFYARAYAECIKGMIEWSGDILLKEFGEHKENPFAFKHINFYEKYTNMKESDLLICFSEEVFATKLLHVIKEDENNLIINLINQNIKKDYVVKSIPTFEIKEVQFADKLESSSSFSEIEEVVTKKENWYDLGTEVYINDKELYFPPLKRHKKIDEYNKVIPFDLTKKEIKEIKIEEVKEETKEIREEIKLIKEKFTVKNEIISYNFKSLSDLKSSINVLETILPKKIVILPVESNLSKVFYYKLKLNKVFDEVFLMNKEISLYSQKGYMSVGLDPEFNKLSYKVINDNSYLNFEGVVIQNELKFIKESQDCAVIGEFNFKELRKKFLENGLMIESINDNKICVSKEVIIERKERDIYIEGSYNSLYFYVLNVLNNFVFYV